MKSSEPMLMLAFHYSHEYICLLTRVYSTVECPHIYLLLRFYTVITRCLAFIHCCCLVCFRLSVFTFLAYTAPEYPWLHRLCAVLCTCAGQNVEGVLHFP